MFVEEPDSTLRKLALALQLEDAEVMAERMKTHALRRTSPRGEGMPFAGRCVLCGKENLSASACMEPCENPKGLTAGDVLAREIEHGAIPPPTRQN